MPVYECIIKAAIFFQCMGIVRYCTISVSSVHSTNMAFMTSYKTTLSATLLIFTSLEPFFAMGNHCTQMADAPVIILFNKLKVEKSLAWGPLPFQRKIAFIQNEKLVYIIGSNHGCIFCLKVIFMGERVLSIWDCV